ncbi:GvpL/GvpF family gas vesicle protein [Kitasatospora sp. NPDC004240]
MAVYVYAIADGGHPARLDGLAGVGDPPEELTALEESDLIAVVSSVPDALRARRRDVMAHQGVLQDLMADGPVLPLRFGTVAGGSDEVRATLKENAGFYRERLRALTGCAEYLLKASFDEEVVLRRILLDSPQAQQLNEESRRTGSTDVKLRLGELLAGQLQERGRAAAAQVHDAVAPLAREIHENEPHGDDVLSFSLLVQEERREELLDAEADLAERLGEGVRFRLHGPLPPYSFV